MKIDYRISAVKPYINWDYFYFAWGVHNKPQEEKQRLRDEAERLLQKHGGHYQTHALFLLLNANSDGDDILAGYPGQGAGERLRLPFLRQQHGDICLCLADFIRPLSAGIDDQMGIFAATTDEAMVSDFDHDPYLKMMMQLLADRLAEATAERLHKEVRQTYWGYAADEHLSMDDLHMEIFQGIRPAVGYPSLPDASFNFLIDRLLHMNQIGITLTENGAMKPHASVSGLMIAHPEARYFDVGKIDEQQLHDYARRRGLPVEKMRKFLQGNV